MPIKEYISPYSKARLISRLRLPDMQSSGLSRPASQPTLQKTQYHAPHSGLTSGRIAC